MRDERVGIISEKVARDSLSESWRDAARATGGVPVYEDVGGILVIGPDRGVLLYTPSDGRATLATDPWERMAFIRAAKLHDELAGLAPPRPGDARICTCCGGTGAREAENDLRRLPWGRVGHLTAQRTRTNCVGRMTNAMEGSRTASR